jgi:nicotinamidase-related amidase
MSAAHRKKLIICEEKPMPELSHIDPRSAALLVMDYQVDALTRFMTVAQSAGAIARVPGLIAMARDAGMMVIHVVVAFRPGYRLGLLRHSYDGTRRGNATDGRRKISGRTILGTSGAPARPRLSDARRAERCRGRRAGKLAKVARYG